MSTSETTYHILLISLFTIKYLMQQVFSQKSSIQKWTLKLRNIYKKCDLLREEINCRFASVFHQHFSSSFYFPNPLLTSTLKEEWGTEQMGSSLPESQGPCSESSFLQCPRQIRIHSDWPFRPIRKILKNCYQH